MTCVYLGHRQSVRLLHRVEEEQAVVLHHLVLVAQRLVDLAHPPTHRVHVAAVQIQTAQEGGGGHGGVLVDDGLLDVTLHLREKRGLMNRQKRSLHPESDLAHEDCWL